jgi:hypothetical protein
MAISNMTQAQSIMKPGVCTSSTRPASPYDGQVIYETDTDRAMVWNNAAWVVLSEMGTWTTYTPGLSQSVTVTKTVNHARYMQVGKTVMGSVYMTATSAGTGGFTIRSSFPVTPVASIYNNTQSFGATIGSGGFYKSSGGAQYSFSVQCIGGGSDSLAFYATGTGGSMFGQFPAVTIASGDHIFFNFTYETA